MITTCKFLAWCVGGSKYGKRRVDEPLTEFNVRSLKSEGIAREVSDEMI
jgi:hypothetical protein